MSNLYMHMFLPDTDTRTDLFVYGLHGTCLSELAPTSGGISLSKRKVWQICVREAFILRLPRRHHCEVLRNLASSLYKLEAQVPNNVGVGIVLCCQDSHLFPTLQGFSKSSCLCKFFSILS